VFAAVAGLLPLNLAAFAVLNERGLFTGRGVSRVVVIAAQVLAVDLTIRLDWSAGREWFTHALVDEWVTTWTALPQASLFAFGVAATFLTARCVLRRDPIETGFLWALLSAFAALQGMRWGWAPSSFLATGGLALIWALVETTYRMAYYDELTGLPGRRALNEAYSEWEPVRGGDGGRGSFQATQRCLRARGRRPGAPNGGGRTGRHHRGREALPCGGKNSWCFARATAFGGSPH
jgi:hypothetical protein